MKKTTLVIHPYILAVTPPLSLFLANVYKLSILDVLPTLLLAWLLMFLIWALIQKLVKHSYKSGLIFSIFAILWFSFGQIIPSLKYLLGILVKIDISPQIDNNIQMYSILMLIVVVILISAGWVLTVKLKSDLHLLTQTMNVVSIVLAGMMIFRAVQALMYMKNIVQENQALSQELTQLGQAQTGITSAPMDLPDIYYIILDGHGRSDVLWDNYSYDDSAFLGELEGLGFFVAEQSRANYVITVLSLASSLNMIYLDDIARVIGTESNNPAPLITLMGENSVMLHLKTLGYTNIAFATGYAGTEIRKADLFYSPTISISGYQHELINMTPVRILMKDLQYDNHRTRIEYIFSRLPEIAENEQPTFTFAHILAPHPPFVYDGQGNSVYPVREFSVADGSHFTHLAGRDEYVSGYREQISYIDQRVLNAVREILARSDQPPIIILQSDHGPGSRLDFESIENSDIRERSAILNAYYFPDENYHGLYPDITPVNSFRLIFSQYLAAELELLPDQSYFSTMIHPYDFYLTSDEAQR